MCALVDKQFMEQVVSILDQKLESVKGEVSDDVYNWYTFLKNQCIQFLKEVADEPEEISAQKMRGDVISYNIFAFSSDEDFAHPLTDELVKIAKERDGKVGDWSVHL